MSEVMDPANQTMPAPQHEIACRDILVEEYKALRAEIIRSATVLSNTVWLATSAFALTVISAMAIKSEVEHRAFLPLVGLLVQSTAASGMFLQELSKYIRAGTYIRQQIEPRLYLPLNDVLFKRMGWESWINDNRRHAKAFVISLIILEIPPGSIIIYWLYVRISHHVSALKGTIPCSISDSFGFPIIMVCVLSFLLTFNIFVVLISVHDVWLELPKRPTIGAAARDIWEKILKVSRI